MPDYPYRCKDCGRSFTVVKAISQAADPEVCLFCGGETKRTYTPAQLGFGHWKPDPKRMDPENAQKEWIAAGGNE